MRKLILTFAAVAMTCGVSANAAPLIIEFTGLNLKYDGTKLFDASDPNGDNLNPSQADPLKTVEFTFNGSTIYSINTNAWADILIPDVTGISAATNAVTTITVDPNTDSYFDLLIGSPVTEYLKLDIDEIKITYVDVSGVVQFVLAGGVSAIDDQALPLNLELFDPVAVSFSTRIDPGTLTNNGTDVTGFKSSGTGEVSGDAQIPEPATMILAFFALCTWGVSERMSHRSN